MARRRKTDVIKIVRQSTAQKFEVIKEFWLNEIREAIKRGPRSGIQYSGQPAQSSLASEFPQEQFGDLLASVGVRNQSDVIALIGFLDENLGKLQFLENRNATLQRIFLDPERWSRLKTILAR